MQEFISETIGCEYLKWKGGDIVLLTAATGSGKTYFMLHELLPYVAKRGEGVLYLVNRRILKEQLEAEISDLPIEQQGCIEVWTYQLMEELLKNNKKINLPMYIICDEAHYFSTDSLFNTYTQLVYNWISENGDKKIRIFISATLEIVRQKIEKDEKKKRYYRSEIYQYPTRGLVNPLQNSREFWIYEAQRDYSYLDCHMINTVEDIYAQIASSSEKWLQV